MPSHREGAARVDTGLDEGNTQTRGAGTAGSINAMFTTLLPDTYKWEDVFDAWDAAAHDAMLAWDTWLASAPHERGDAYARYRASLDREERAAAVLASAARSRHRRVNASRSLLPV